MYFVYSNTQMNKAYISILLLLLSLVINSLVSSTYLPLHEGAKNKGKKKKSKKNKNKKRKKKNNMSIKPARDHNKTLSTVKNIMQDTIPPLNKVDLIKSFIIKQ